MEESVSDVEMREPKAAGSEEPTGAVSDSASNHLDRADQQSDDEPGCLRLCLGRATSQVFDCVAENPKLVGTFGVCLAIVIVVLIAKSFVRVDSIQMGISYDKVSRRLGNEALEPGVYRLGPSGSVVTFLSTQFNLGFNAKCWTRDTIPITAKVDIALSLDRKQLRRILDDWGDQDSLLDYVTALGISVSAEVSRTFSMSNMLERPQDFQQAVQTALVVAVKNQTLPIVVDFLQLVKLTPPPAVSDAFLQTTLASLDVLSAEYQRQQSIQTAEIAYELTLQQAQLTTLAAAQVASNITRTSDFRVELERSRLAQYTATFTNITSSIGLGGHFFIDRYLPGVVLKQFDGPIFIDVTN